MVLIYGLLGALIRLPLRPLLAREGRQKKSASRPTLKMAAPIKANPPLMQPRMPLVSLTPRCAISIMA